MRIGQAMSSSGLIRIKNDYVEKLGGCALIINTGGSTTTTNIVLPWFVPPIDKNFIAFGNTMGLAVTDTSTVHGITPIGFVSAPFGTVSAWTLAIWGVNEWLLSAYEGQGIWYWPPSEPLSGSGVSLPISGLTFATISSGTYNSGTGATAIVTTSATGIVAGMSITLGGLTGTGGFASLDGTWTVTGASGTTIDFTATTGLGSTTITGGNILSLGVPSKVSGIFVAAPQQQTFAWGAYSATLGDQDPLLLAWCDVANITDWTANVNNQAGSFRLSSGSSIIGATWFGVVGLIWTDVDLWAANYIGFPLVYGFQRIAQNCGLVSRQAWAILGTAVIWMGQNDFFSYDGGAVHIIPCSVRDFVFNTIDRTKNIHADSNSYENEVTFRFCQNGSNGKCNAYAKWSPSGGGAWDIWQDPVGGPLTSMWDPLESTCRHASLSIL